VKKYDGFVNFFGGKKLEQTVELNESKKISNIIAARKTISSLLQGDITFKLISLAKDIDGLDFQHVNYVTEKIIEKIDKKDLENVIFKVIDVENVKVKEPEKLYNFLDKFITKELVGEILFTYNKKDYMLNKIEEGHKVIFNECI
jgi:putative mammaglobin-A